MRGILDPRILLLTAAVTFWVAGFDVLYAARTMTSTERRACIRSRVTSALPGRCGLRACSTYSCWCLLVALVIAFGLGKLAMAGVVSWCSPSFLRAFAGVVRRSFQAQCGVFHHERSDLGCVLSLHRRRLCCFRREPFAGGIDSRHTPVSQPPLRTVVSSRQCPRLHSFQTDDARLGPIHRQGDGRRSDSMPRMPSLSTVPAIFWPSAGWPITFANACTATRRTSTSTAHLNPTNVCVAACRLCAFGRKKDTPGAYTMALEEAFETAASGYTEAVTEFHIVGGLHPDLPFQYFLDLFQALSSASRRSISKPSPWSKWPILSKRAKLSIRETLEQLKAAGVDSLAGRRRGDFRRPRTTHHLRPQDRRRRVARYRPAGASDRIEVERDHALRPRRKR